MSRIPRFVGYALMAGAVVLAILERRGTIASVGPLPVIAAVLLLGMVGVMLVFTDLMVRGLYAQVDVAKRAPPPADGAEDADAK
ncbi:hypothetical protein EEB18_011685 [Sphingopyxis sp. OPL5]|uniref:hypothetical protein n=1 Tax=Sphingopyxis sp. OPL5 TaxID=2486273 RepID=UPI0008AA7BD3|nr:hypothetical protein [Sphingopyxis sp. OPL5]OHC98763.1 MAG: hypothetical protein A2885_17080 [Sphingopyxis sp. RIFCSPHIGHO2_01_FULL_65_24]QNO25469.1 hypothetical protein EEB18_011685 [Sphingopyxis sp. OPL5]